LHSVSLKQSSLKGIDPALKHDMRRNLVIDALQMAWLRRRPDRNKVLIVHSDRGSQYASDNFNEVLKEYAITRSMSRKGNRWDNACSQTLFGSLKVERLHGQCFETFRQAKDETIAWPLWYNQTLPLWDTHSEGEVITVTEEVCVARS
jgi:putative transposase